MWSQLRRAIQLKVVCHVYDNFVAPASLNQGAGKGIIDHFAIWLGVPIGEELHARVRRHYQGGCTVAKALPLVL